MKEWLRISLILCTFGFFREMRPSEPFVTEFLSGEWRNITSEQVNRDIYPLGTYSYLAQLVIVFLITDMLRYKPIILVSALVGIILWCLLLWTTTLLALQFVQLCYGTFMAAEVAYYTYMYAKVERSKYQQVTGHARAGILSGRFLAGVLAQILVSYKLMDLRELNYISLGSQCISLIWALMLPPVRTSMYFYAKDRNGNDQLENVTTTAAITPSIMLTTTNNPANNNDKHKNNDAVSYSNKGTDVNKEIIRKKNYFNKKLSKRKVTQHNDGDCVGKAQEIQTPTTSIITTITPSPSINPQKLESENVIRTSFSCNRATHLLWEHFISAYSSLTVLQWSIWWALATCGFLQVQSYVQLLWQQIDPGQENFYNGGVEAVLTLCGAGSALAAGIINNERFEKWDMLILTICSGIEGIFIIYSGYTNNVWAAYCMYVAFGVLYQFMITIVCGTVAKHLVEDSFGLIFGINTLFALIFQSILTVVVISESGLALDPRGQFIAFGFYFIALSIIYGVVGLIQYYRKRMKA